MEAASPIKGLERLSEELRLERQKANYALQEKARIRVEIESYKQNIEQQREHIGDLEQKCEAYSTQVHDLEQQLQTTRIELGDVTTNVQQSKQTIRDLESSLDHANNEIERYRQQVADRDSEMHELRIRMETLEKKGQTKDDLIQSLKDELLSVRKSQMAFEEEKEQVYSRLNQQATINQELQAQLQLVGAKESGYHETIESNAELRDALEKTLLLNTALNNQVRDLQGHLSEKTAQEHALQQENLQLHSIRTQLLEEISVLQREHDDTVGRMDAEIDAKLAAQEKADAAVKNRLFLENQMTAMRTSYEDALNSSAQLEREVAEHKQTISDLQEQILHLREKETQLEKLQQQVTNQQAVSLELETLRTQLQVMRKKLVKKDLEEEAQVVAPRALLEREQQGRLVYEGIIADLRKEVDRVTALYHDAVRRCDDLTLQASRVEALQEEIELYKETARAISQESQTMALTASEVAERSVKATHERHGMLQALQASQTALHSTQAELERVRNENTEMKEKVKQYHSAKLQADKRVTEISATNARLEASMESFQQQFDSQTIALEETKRQFNDLQRQFGDHQRQHADCDTVKRELEQLKAQSFSTGQDQHGRIVDLERLLESRQVEKEMLQSEVASLKEKLSVQKASVDHLQQELLVARRNYDEAHLQVERYRVESENSARHAQHSQIVSLQEELRRTMQEWSALEVEQTAKDTLIEQLRVDYGREKERAMLLKMQLSVMEEKLQVVTQELQVYRGIDVYHAARQAELLAKTNATNAAPLAVDVSASQAEAESKSKHNGGRGSNSDEDDEDDEDFFGRSRSAGGRSAGLFGGSVRAAAPPSSSPPRQPSRLSLADISSAPRDASSSHRADDDYFFARNANSRLLAPPSPPTSRPRGAASTTTGGSPKSYFSRALSASRSTAPRGDSDRPAVPLNTSSYAAPAVLTASSGRTGATDSATDDLLARAELMRERQMRRLERERALRAQILTEERSLRLSSAQPFASLASTAGYKTPQQQPQPPPSTQQTPIAATPGTALASATRSARMDLDRARRLLSM